MAAALGSAPPGWRFVFVGWGMVVLVLLMLPPLPLLAGTTAAAAAAPPSRSSARRLCRKEGSTALCDRSIGGRGGLPSLPGALFRESEEMLLSSAVNVLWIARAGWRAQRTRRRFGSFRRRQCRRRRRAALCLRPKLTAQRHTHTQTDIHTQSQRRAPLRDVLDNQTAKREANKQTHQPLESLPLVRALSLSRARLWGPRAGSPSSTPWDEQPHVGRVVQRRARRGWKLRASAARRRRRRQLWVWRRRGRSRSRHLWRRRLRRALRRSRRHGRRRLRRRRRSRIVL